MATVYSSSALHKKEKSAFSSLPFPLGGGNEKHLTQPGGRRWTTPVLIPTPAFVRRPITIHVPLPPSVYRSLLARKYGQLVALVALGILAILALTRRRHPHYENSSQAPTLVFGRQDLRRIWQWEIAAGHYPSTRRIPTEIQLHTEANNPALPLKDDIVRALRDNRRRFAKNSPEASAITYTVGTGPERSYLNIRRSPHDRVFPPRPIPYSVADLDMVMDYCQFPDNYVRDCLEVLRVASGLDATRVRHASTDHWNYIFKELINPGYEYSNAPGRTQAFRLDKAEDVNAGLTFKDHVKPEPLELSEPHPTVFRPTPQQPCDPNYPRLFHMFWTGPFTDKPYMAILSFLYTQNVALNVPQGKEDKSVCKPEFWMWIKPGSAAAETSPNAYAEMFDGLAVNQWAAPFLHDRFKDVIKFKLWNTTEQLDGVPEIKDVWRHHADTLFNAGGYVYKVPKRKSTSTSEMSTPSMVSTNGVDPKDITIVTPEDDDIFTRVGSRSQETYDRLSVILSDMVRFVLCHRFGGIYLDADTLLLRDWEELWGWKGAFAYRWSRLPSYNTAVLRLNKGSALGTFLFKTALNNKLDFHPMTVSRYLKDAHLEELLMMLPDAMFDPAWLNTEYYQLDRPPFPFFSRFTDFFETPPAQAAAPQAVGLEGFFKGAYAYHWHNQWWEAFDPVRKYPDLGPVFSKMHEHKYIDDSDWVETVELDDIRDLSWAAVTKRTLEGWVRGERPNLYGEWFVQ